MHPEYLSVPYGAYIGCEYEGMVHWVDPDFRPRSPDQYGHGGTVDTPRAMIEVRHDHGYPEDGCGMCSSLSGYRVGSKGWHYDPDTWGPEGPPLWRHP